jgi:hypothetical protein
MNAAQWQKSTNLPLLLERLTERASLRKLRLFRCACCRRVWDSLGEAARAAVAVAERFADGEAARGEVSYHAVELAKGRSGPGALTGPTWLAETALHWINTRAEGLRAALGMGVRTAALVARQRGVEQVGYTWGQWSAEFKEHPAFAGCLRVPCDVLRELFGNPFREVKAPARWPAALKGLAGSLYAGEDCAHVLHDALLDAGRSDLAEHFSDPWHPKGCWAVDLILKKR